MRVPHLGLFFSQYLKAYFEENVGLGIDYILQIGDTP